MIEDHGVSVRLILGNAYGKTAPAKMLSETFYADVTLEAGNRLPVLDDHEGAQFMILGGATFSGPRSIWWNFVASSQERIEAAKVEWRAARWGKGRFDLPVDDRDAHIPAPD